MRLPVLFVGILLSSVFTGFMLGRIYGGLEVLAACLAR